jgi:hypothetical protein
MNESDVVYVVNRVQISASEYNSNGYIRTFLFRDKLKAEKCLKDLRSEDLTELDRLRRDYEIYTDSEEKFHVSWDSDLEKVFISLKEKTIELESLQPAIS